MTQAIFGRVLTAMVSPFEADGSVDVQATAKLAKYLVDVQRNDALVVNGTTGESPTTSDADKSLLVSTAKEAVGDSAQIIAGVGTTDTAHSVKLAKEAKVAGADGLLIVTPYYALPPQDAIIKHFQTIADATDLPCVLYDIPHRAGRPIETASLLELAKHPNIVAVKDAKKDLTASAQVIAQTDLAYYSGDDAMTLPLLSIGGVGVVGTSTHFTGRRTAEMVDAYFKGDLAEALRIYQALLPVYTGVFATQGCMLVKAGLKHLGMPVGGLRAPMQEASPAQAAAFAAILDAADL